jgi:serralysin
VSGIFGIDLDGMGNMLMNQGTITGIEAAVRSGGASRIVNSGTIGSLDIENPSVGSASGLALGWGFNTVTNEANGVIQGYRHGIEIVTGGNTILNAGTITSHGVTVKLSAEGEGHQRNYVLNSGTLSTRDGNQATFLSIGDVTDILVNTGTLEGTAYLGGGDDTYVNQGKAPGIVHGEGGNDSFHGRVNYADIFEGGAGADFFDGGDEPPQWSAVDVVSYADARGGVRADLSRPSANTGEAAGDRYVEIECLDGSSFADTLIGSGVANRLDGRGGADRMQGGAGNDSYVVDSRSDVVIEPAGKGSGRDTINASVSYGLSPNVEDLFLEGPGSLSGTGNDLNNAIYGTFGDNVLNGAGGRDMLEGNGGQDTFVFNTALGAGNVDTVTDFTAGYDTIRLENAVFRGLNAGALSGSAFWKGTAAHDRSDRIVYDGRTGKLFFDADGTGAIAAIHFATLANGGQPLAMTAADFMVV